MNNSTAINIISEFTPEMVKVGSRTFEDSFIITADAVISPWIEKGRQALTSSDLSSLLALDVDFLLVGTGAMQVIPDASVYREFIDKGMSIEFMDSAAACRTYNILAGEQRRIGAGITLPIE